MANYKIPTHLKLLRGNPGKQALPKNEPEPEIPPQCPEPPHHVAGYALDEWWRIAPELYRINLLTVVDVGPLAAYCQAYGRWRIAEETLAAMAARDQVTSGLLIKTESGAKVNPLVLVANRAAADMVRYAGEFGLTPAARARLAAGPFDSGDGHNKFAGLLAS